MTLDQSAYLQSLDAIDIFEASGGVDFEALTQHCLKELVPARK
jgi:hypothetical protein